jgi:hypothetical protein
MKRAPSIRDLKRWNDPKVVILPTAAPKQVQQQSNRASREARCKLRSEQPWPGEHLHPGQRQAIENAKAMAETQQTPELVLAMAMFAALDPEGRAKVDEQLALAVLTGCVAARRAQAKVSIRTIGDRIDSDFAFRYLEGDQ